MLLFASEAGYINGRVFREGGEKQETEIPCPTLQRMKIMRNGDKVVKREQNFQKLYADTYDGLIQYISHLCRYKDLAEDILQETYYEALLQYDDLLKHENIKGWLYQTASYKMFNYTRKYSRESGSLDSVGEMGSCERIYGELEWKVALTKLIGEVDVEIFWAHYVLGYSGKEIAAVLGISETCLRVRMHRIKKKIRENLER